MTMNSSYGLTHWNWWLAKHLMSPLIKALVNCFCKFWVCLPAKKNSTKQQNTDKHTEQNENMGGGSGRESEGHHFRDIRLTIPISYAFFRWFCKNRLWNQQIYFLSWLFSTILSSTKFETAPIKVFFMILLSFPSSSYSDPHPEFLILVSQKRM